ncbi:MAG: hypothetical protein ABI443_00400 [Chthoniobacterales bacterium]
MTLKKITTLCILAILTIAMSNCTAIRKDNSHNKESLLAAAGYKQFQVTSAKQQAMVTKMPPYKTVMRHKNGKTYYTYYDPSKNVVFAGKPSNYMAYKKLALKQSMIDDEIIAESDAESESMDWGSFGPGWY